MTKIFKLVASLFIATAFVACNGNSKKGTDCNPETTQEELSAAKSELGTISDTIHEEVVFGVPVLIPVEAPIHQEAAKPKTHTNPVVEEKSAYTPPVVTQVQSKKPTASELRKRLESSNFTVKETKKDVVPEVSFSSKNLDEVQTVTSFERGGEEYLTVVSNPNNEDEIDYMTFTDRQGHTDVYGVSAGMSAKDARHLRHDLKHFTRKGKVFLHHENSNILYQLDGKATEGQTFTDEEIDKMKVSSVIWKHKDDVRN